MAKLLVLLVAALSGCAQQLTPKDLSDSLHWVDLGHSFDHSTLYWPNNLKGFEHYTDADGETASGYYYSSFSLCTPEHGGTHLDAPVHFAKNKLSVDRLPLSSLTGEAIKIDVSARSLSNRDYQISIQDILDWESSHGTMPDNMIVLFRTGYEQYYPDRKNYFGTGKTGHGAIPLLHFPGILPSTAQWLIDNRRIKALGLDTPSLDYGQSKDFKTHQILLGRDKPGFENLTNLKLLPAKGFYVVALPMKIAHGSGGPLRIIAGTLSD